MTNKSQASFRHCAQPNPKIEPTPELEYRERTGRVGLRRRPDDRSSDVFLKTLSEECGEPQAFDADLTKAEASKHALKTKRKPVQHR